MKKYIGLTPREREILIMHFGLNGEYPKSLREIGRHFHVSGTRIDQIQSRALTKMGLKKVESIYVN